MKLRYITCSGVNEELSYDKLIDLSKQSPLVEIGVTANTSTTYKWLEQLLSLKDSETMNLALHINGKLCSDFCAGKIDPDANRLMHKKDKKGGSLIRRWQLNITSNMYLNDTNNIQNIIKNNPDKEFIFSCNRNPIILSFINKLYKSGLKISLLYNSSYESSILPKRWEIPYSCGYKHGYSGELDAENVYDNLTEISLIVPSSYQIWIDAEHNLKTPGTTKFDAELAKAYIKNAIKWHEKNAR